MRIYVEHNGLEVNGIKKLKYITISDIVEAYVLYPISDFLYDALKLLNKELTKLIRLYEKYRLKKHRRITR